MKISTHFAVLCLSLGTTACGSLNYPDPETSESNSPASSQIDGVKRSRPPSPPVLLDVGFGVPEEDLAPDLTSLDPSGENGAAQAWFELTKRARLARSEGRFDDARELLEQASIQLTNRPPTNAQRRAVFGMRARLARDFDALDRKEESEALADVLFAEAVKSPELGGAALADLAHLIASRRDAKAKTEGLVESPIPLLRIALSAAENETPSQLRLSRAFEISQIAMREGEHDLARRAIDRAVLDAQTLASSDKDQLASHKIFKARIALAQGDLITAEASAAAANRLFDEMNAPPANRADAESTMARIVAESGDAERARAIIAGARARLDTKSPLPPYVVRLVLGEAARVERALGSLDESRALYSQALAIVKTDAAVDRQLSSDLQDELLALDAPTPE